MGGTLLPGRLVRGAGAFNFASGLCRPAREDRLPHFRLEARAARNLEGIKNAGD